MTEEVKNDTVVLSETAQNVIGSIEAMTVLELADLVKALEDKFGVVAAPAAVAAPLAGAAGAADGAAEEKKDSVNVVLKSCGDKKIKVLKALREVTELGLKEAKDVVDNLPKTIKEGVSQEDADKIKTVLEAEGGEVSFE
tara:strand:+ start:7875 stop:8294 length:420 start_codon:yes stop_codon:yes gene_type:complete